MNNDAMIPNCAHTTLAILAGGEGRRMGTPKGVLTLDGRPILDRLLDRLNWPGPTLLITAPGREHPPGWQRFTNEVTDPIAGEGPLRGILTALEHSSTNEIVVLPVDMPNVTPPPLAWLAARLRDNPTAAAVMTERPGRAPSRIEPLPAAFRTNIAQTLIRAQLANRQLALHQLAKSPEIIVVPASPAWPTDFWVNLNTPSDLATYNSDSYYFNQTSIASTSSANSNDPS
jgi:molybdopterin-guanine dinucleotide biosynthesis protein A